MIILFINDKDSLVWAILSLILINTWLLLYNFFFTDKWFGFLLNIKYYIKYKLLTYMSLAWH